MLDSLFTAEMRQQMPVSVKQAYFDHAAVAPLCGPAAVAMAHWVQQASCEGDLVWPEWARQVEQTRQLAANLLGADKHEMAFVPNTSTGINIVAQGFPWQTGDNMITLGNEFPANQYPWMNLADRGVELRVVPVDGVEPDIGKLLDTCDARTRLISVSWVSYCTGYRFNLVDIIEEAHRRGVLVFVDAIQGLGVFPLSVEKLDIDFLAADGHKWMLGPEGAGLFFSKREHLDLLRPELVGWNSVQRPFDFDHIHWEPRPTAARFEGGSSNMAGLTGLGASLNFLSDLGLTSTESPLAEQVLDYIDMARHELEAIGAECFGPTDRIHQSGILSFDFPGQELPSVRQRCMEQGVVLSLRAGRLRISPHAYNNRQDLDRLLNVLTNA
ncbi:MAG: aminotransferase class V-fold PLP-dependent enzyme [Planctomycetota bacterium]|nr:aminotransferase class V-fold PLP-dependent enzyme [Planctomycetota bacterium]